MQVSAGQQILCVLRFCRFDSAWFLFRIAHERVLVPMASLVDQVVDITTDNTYHTSDERLHAHSIACLKVPAQRRIVFTQVQFEERLMHQILSLCRPQALLQPAEVGRGAQTKAGKADEAVILLFR